MNILVINCGSSSLKYQLIDMKNEEVMCKGAIERIGMEIKGGEENVIIKIGDAKFTYDKELLTHTDAFNEVKYILSEGEHKVVDSFDQIDAIGHRIVQGGDKYTKSVIVDEKVAADVKALSPLAPLHNPANILGIKACMDLMPGTPEVAAFDTAFHQTIPKDRYIYPIPYDYYKKCGTRKYASVEYLQNPPPIWSKIPPRYI